MLYAPEGATGVKESCNYYLLACVRKSLVKNKNFIYSPVFYVYVEHYLSIYLSIYLWLYIPCGYWPLFSFLIYTQSVGLLGSGGGGQPAASPLPTHRTTQTQNENTQISMPRVGLEPATPVFEP
jgi:hypothetical protein